MSQQSRKKMKVNLRTLDKLTDKRFETFKRLVDLADSNDIELDINLEDFGDQQRNIKLENDNLDGVIQRIAEKHKSPEGDTQQVELVKIAVTDKAITRIQSSGSPSSKKQILKRLLAKGADMGIGVLLAVLVEKLITG